MFHAPDRHSCICLPVVPLCSIPAHRLDPDFPSPPENRRWRRSHHACTPRSPYRAAHPSHCNHSLLCALPCHRLNDRDLTQRPRLVHLSTQINAHFITPIHICGTCSDRYSRGRKPSLFRAACASTDAWGDKQTWYVRSSSDALSERRNRLTRDISPDSVQTKGCCTGKER